jgi:hypothetical protein
LCRYRFESEDAHFTTRHGRSLALEDMQRSVDRLHSPFHSMPSTPPGTAKQLLASLHNCNKMLTKTLSLVRTVLPIHDCATDKSLHENLKLKSSAGEQYANWSHSGLKAGW